MTSSAFPNQPLLSDSDILALLNHFDMAHLDEDSSFKKFLVDSKAVLSSSPSVQALSTPSVSTSAPVSKSSTVKKGRLFRKCS